MSAVAPPARSSAGDVAAFFAVRLRGPADARSAVLAALARGAPFPLVDRALSRGRELGVPGGSARRAGLLAEVVRAALEVSASALGREPSHHRLDRAMRVLVADTLLTFAFELLADLPETSAAPERLAATLGPAGPLGALARNHVRSPDGRAEERIACPAAEGGRDGALPGPRGTSDSSRVARAFLEDILLDLSRLGPPGVSASA